MNDEVEKGPESSVSAKVLVVEDEASLNKAYCRTLVAAGYEVGCALSAKDALSLLDAGDFDVALCDINLPDISGSELLRKIRDKSRDVEVVLITGSPTIESAVDAVEFGARSYLVKPVDSERLVRTVSTAAGLHRIARLQRDAVTHAAQVAARAHDLANVSETFDRGLAALWMAFQPIVNIFQQRIVGYEALVRTSEAAIPHPGVFFQMAEQLNRLQDIGRGIRAAIGHTLASRPIEADIFVNLHPQDLFDSALYSESCPIAAYSSQIVLEITERAALDESAGVAANVRSLKKMGYRIAIDDLGAGYAGLNYLTMLEPDIVKLDMALIRNVHVDPVKRKLVTAMCNLCRDIGVAIIAEGVECAGEVEVLRELSCDHLQGFFFAKPGQAFPTVIWDEK